MHQSKLLSVIRTMDADAMRKALAYLKINHADKGMLPLFEYIKKYHEKLDHPKLSKKEVFKGLFPERTTYDDKALRVQMSNLVKALEDFFVQQMLEEDTATRQRLLARYYARKDNYDLFEEVTQAKIKQLEDHPRSDMEYQLERWAWHHEWFFHPSTPKIPNLAALKTLMTSLDQFFVLAKLRYSADVFTRKKIVSEDFSIELLQEVLVHCEAQQFYNNPVIELYSYLLQMQLNTPDEGKFKKCINLLETNVDKIKKYEKEFMLNSLINKAIYYQNIGFTQYRTFAITLFKLAIEQNLLLDKGKLKSTTFLNIALLAIGEKEFEWAKQFIEKFKDSLPEEDHFESLQLALAYWFFYQGIKDKNHNNFSQALELLSKINYTKLEINLRIRSLQIRIYYEIENINLVLDFANSFKKYLSRHSDISIQKKESYKIFIDILFELKKLKSHTEIDLNELWKIKKKVIQTNSLILKEWILEKIEELLLTIPPKS